MVTLPGSTDIGRVDLTVADSDTLSDFYTSVVGLQRLEQTGDRVDLGVASSTLLRLFEDPLSRRRGVSQAGLFHLAIRAPERLPLAFAYRRLREAGSLTGASDHLVSEALYGRDPEENGIEIYRDRSRRRWELTDDGGIRIVTWPLDLDDLEAMTKGVSSPHERLPTGTDIGHVHLEVTDLDRARTFYVDTLGFDIKARYPGALFIAAGDYHHHIGLNVWNERREPAGERGLRRFELCIPDRSLIDELADAIESTSLGETDVIDRSNGSVTVHDPDGIELSLRDPGLSSDE